MNTTDIFEIVIIAAVLIIVKWISTKVFNLFTKNVEEVDNETIENLKLENRFLCSRVESNEREIKKWKNSFFKSEEHNSELAKRNAYLHKKVDKYESIINAYTLQPKHFENQYNKFFSEICRNAGMTVEEAIKTISPNLPNTENHDSKEIIQELSQRIINTHKSITSFKEERMSVRREQLPIILESFNESIKNLLELCKQHN